MNQGNTSALKSFFLKDVDQIKFIATLKKLMLTSFASSLLATIDGAAFYMPIIFALFIVYFFYEEKQRLKYIVYLLPIFFFLIFLVGAAIALNWVSYIGIENQSFWSWIISGILCSYLIIISIWILFKVKLHFAHFLTLTILIPIPYLLGFDGIHENSYPFLFYLLWNGIVALVLSLIFSQTNNKTAN